MDLCYDCPAVAPHSSDERPLKIHSSSMIAQSVIPADASYAMTHEGDHRMCHTAPKGQYHPQGATFVPYGVPLKTGMSAVYDRARVHTFESPIEWRVTSAVAQPRAGSVTSSSSSEDSSSISVRTKGNRRCCGSTGHGAKSSKGRGKNGNGCCHRRKQHHHLSEGTHNHHKSKTCC